jgi:quercetin dioxygenase-like cupin family protein
MLSLVGDARGRSPRVGTCHSIDQEVHMKAIRSISIVAMSFASGLVLHGALAQQTGVTRTDLMKHDLSAAGHEVVQARVALDPGVAFPRHWHPGEELVYVLEGTLEYQLGDDAPVVLKAGEVLFIPARTPHTAKNVGTVRGAELATYIVEKGEPVLVFVK